MTNPYISIIIPLYNKEEYIKETLLSCTTQLYDNFEIIVVDDGSTDASSQIVNSFNDSRLSYYKQVNAGVSVARNFGALKANGDWLYMLDADDTIFPDALSLFAKAIRLQPNANVIVGKEWHSVADDIINRREWIPFVSQNPFKDFFKKRFFPAAGLALVKKKIFLDVQYETNCRFYEDIQFYLRLMRVSKPWAWFEIPMFKHPANVRGLSVSQHPIEVEGAYFLKPQKYGSIFEALCYLELLGNCQWWRSITGDMDGVLYYMDKKKKLFSYWHRFVFYIYSKYKNKHSQ